MSEKDKDTFDLEEEDNEDKTHQEYNAHLREAHETNLIDTEISGCVTQGTDEQGVPIIVCIPRIGFDNKNTVNDAQLRKILLLLLKVADNVVKNKYSIVYAHDGAQYWLNRQPIVFRFYKLLPRAYKRNLQNMYIIHPNVGIKMFFEFSRVFLSKKFYDKLSYVEHIVDFQRIVSPLQLIFPYHYLTVEDEELALTAGGVVAPLVETFDVELGTTKLLSQCVRYLRAMGLTSKGLFRVSGDHHLLSLVKIRVQPAWSIDKKLYLDCVIIGDKDYHINHSVPLPPPPAIPLPHHTTTTSDIPQSTQGPGLTQPQMGGYPGGIPPPPSYPPGPAPGTNTNRPSPFFSPERSTGMSRPLSQSIRRLTGGFLGSATLPPPTTTTAMHTHSHSSSGGHSHGYPGGGGGGGGYSGTPGPRATSMRLGLRLPGFFGSSLGSPFGRNNDGSSGRHNDDYVSEISSRSEDTTSFGEDFNSDGMPLKNVALSVVVVTDIDTVAAVLKMLLRDLPEPVVTFATYENIMNLCARKEVSQLSSDQEWSRDILEAIDSMPMAHKETLAHLMRFLREVAAQSSYNSMDITNLSSIFAPSLMRPPMETLDAALIEIRRCQIVTQFLICHYGHRTPPPPPPPPPPPSHHLSSSHSGGQNVGMNNTMGGKNGPLNISHQPLRPLNRRPAQRPLSMSTALNSLNIHLGRGGGNQTALAPGQGPLTEANLRALTAMQEQEYRSSSGMARGVTATGPTGSGVSTGLTGSGRQNSGDHTMGGGIGSPNPPSGSKHTNSNSPPPPLRDSRRLSDVGNYLANAVAQGLGQGLGGAQGSTTPNAAASSSGTSGFSLKSRPVSTPTNATTQGQGLGPGVGSGTPIVHNNSNTLSYLLNFLSGKPSEPGSSRSSSQLSSRSPVPQETTSPNGPGTGRGSGTPPRPPHSSSPCPPSKSIPSEPTHMTSSRSTPFPLSDVNAQGQRTGLVPAQGPGLVPPDFVGVPLEPFGHAAHQSALNYTTSSLSGNHMVPASLSVPTATVPPVIPRTISTEGISPRASFRKYFGTEIENGVNYP